MTDKKLISSLQGLRAVAFLSVVLSHCGAPWLGPWAISVFVALSGFLMTCNYYDRPRTYYDGCCPAPCAEGAPGAALCPWSAVLCSAACGKHFSPANLDSLQPFLVLPERSSVVSFGAGFSVCNLSLAASRAEKGRYSQTALYCCRDFLRTIPFLLCNLEGRTQWKGRILPDLSVSSFPGRRFCHQLLYGLPLPQPQGGAHTLRCLFPSGAGSCAVFGRLLFHRCQTGRSFGRGSLPVQRTVHSLCGAAGLEQIVYVQHIGFLVRCDLCGIAAVRQSSFQLIGRFTPHHVPHRKTVPDHAAHNGGADVCLAASGLAHWRMCCWNGCSAV